MDILIVAATQAEIQPTLDHFQAVEKKATFFTKEKNGHQLDFLITGAGMVQTAFHLGIHFSKKRYDIAFNAGIAGSYVAHLPIGETVFIKTEQFADWGAEDKEAFIPIHELGFFDGDAFPFEKGMLHNPHPLPMSSFFKKIASAKGITINRVVGCQRTIVERQLTFFPEIETMEGAAFFYACLLQNLPFHQIRTISNFAEVRNRSNWDIPLAIKSLNSCLTDILNHWVEN